MKINNIIQPITFLVIYFLVLLVIQRLGGILRKFGLNEFSIEEINELRNMQIPKWVNYINNCLIFGLLVFWLGSWGLIVLKLFPAIQKFAFGSSNTIFFRGASLPYLIIILFSILFFLLPIGGIVSLRFPKYTLYNYASMMKRNLKGMYTLKYTIDFYIKWLIVSFIIFPPLIYLSFQDYVNIDQKKITINPFLSITNKIYTWDEVKYVKLHGYNKANDTPYLDIAFSDGKVFDVWGGWYVTEPGKQGIINLILSAKERNIPFSFQEPTADKKGKLPIYASEVFDFARKVIGTEDPKEIKTKNIHITN